MISSSEFADRIIEKAKSLGASIAGIASVESLKNSPSHKIYPKLGPDLTRNFADPKDAANNADMLWPADAISAVVIGIAHKADEPELDWWDGKGTPGNRILIRINNQLSEWIEATFPVKTCRLPYFVEKGGIFLKDAAVHAGLGCIGKSNLVITPEYGPRIRFRALFLNKEAKPTDSQGFNPCEKCGQPCRTACPVKSFQNKIYSSRALDQAVLPGINGTYDRVACNIKMQNDIEEAAVMAAVNDKNKEKFRQWVNDFEIRHIKSPQGDQPFNGCVKFCRRCELSCPVGFD